MNKVDKGNRSLQTIGFKKLNNKAVLPSKNAGDAGFDLYTQYIEEIGRDEDISENGEQFNLIPGKRYKAKTGISCEIPAGHYGLIKPRSGASFKYGLNVLAGVVDETYRGEIMVIFTITEGMTVRIGDRLAQMVVSPYLSWCEEITETSETERGDDGFGSSGR